MSKAMYTPEEVTTFIEQGRTLILAGHEDALGGLPKGKWIAGTIPYFMGDQGGVFSKELIHVVDITNEVTNIKLATYSSDELNNITEQSFSNGFNFVVLPALQRVLFDFALKAPSFKNLFINPLVGWVAGVAFENVGKVMPKVYVGGVAYTNKAAVLHAEIPKKKVARIEIVNVYKQGNGDEITFPVTGFDGSICKVNGEQMYFCEYLKRKGIKDNLPLVANYAGAMLNVGFRCYEETKRVDLYAPVFSNTIYKLAEQIDNYEQAFKAKLDHEIHAKFACNCLMNYFNFNLEGQKIHEITGPITYGEIGYQLLNQTFVYLLIEKR